MKKLMTALLAGLVFGGVLATSIHLDIQYKQSHEPELRIMAAPEDMILEIETTAANQPFILRMMGSPNVTVDWNDGTIETFTSGGEKSHTFSIIGTYQIKITGTMLDIGFDSFQYYNYSQSNLLLKKVIQWGDTGVTSLSGFFMGAKNLNFVPADFPSSVTDASYLFHQKNTWPDPLANMGTWNMSNVTLMNHMFYGVGANFNTDITNWNVSNVTSMQSMFYNASGFNQNISGWNVGKVTDFKSMFERASSFNQEIGSWNVSNNIYFISMFSYASAFNKDISAWDVSKGTHFNSMFRSASSFNQPLNTWNVSSALQFSGMFERASSFNQPLDQWSTSTATHFNAMFSSASQFNQPLNTWDVSTGATFEGMFSSAIAFNQPLDAWDMSSATTLASMFYDARAFNQNINVWEVSNVIYFQSMFDRTSVFNQPLDQWNVGNGVYFSSMFKSSVFNQDISSWNVSKGTTFQSMFDSNTAFDQPLNAWNISSATTLGSMFRGASKFNQPLGAWNTANVTDMNQMFNGATLFNQDISLWNTGKVVGMYQMFANAKAFNQDISGWDVSNVVNFSGTFDGATDFNADLSEWDTSSATNMSYMFASNTFNQDISGWSTANVTTMSHMFYNNKVFNQDLGDWNTAKVTNFEAMFRDSIFNYDISLWNTSSATNMGKMFMSNTVFNQPIGLWDVSKVQYLYEMFYGATAFNQDLPWTTTALTYMITMFQGATAFNGDISTWDVSKVTNLEGVFKGATSFNQPLDTWNTSLVINMMYTFQNANAFNQDISSWDFSKVQYMNQFMGGNLSLHPLYYDALLQRLTDQTVPLFNFSGYNQLSFGKTKYSKVAKALKDALIADRGWGITDGGELKLTITVDDQDILFGEDDPDYTVTYSGLVENVGEDTLENNFVFTREPGTEVGEYTVSVTGGDESYYYVTYATGTLSIGKPTIDLNEVTWDYEDAFTYDGNEVTVTLLNVPDGVTVTYSGNSATNAGTYTASVTLDYDSVNFSLEGSIEDLSWEILKAEIDMSGVNWNYDDPFIYDGTLLEVTLDNVPESVTPQYTNNAQTNAGSYVASVTFTFDTNNYTLSNDIDDLAWDILKADYDMSSAGWDYDEPFTFDLNEKTVLVTGLPDGVSVDAYLGNTATQPGTYLASVTLTYDVTNYNTPVIDDLEWEIIALTYTITFDTRGGSTIQPILGILGTPITAPANPTRQGHTFNGWDRAIPQTMPAENITITASWAVITNNDNTEDDLEDVIDLTLFEGEDVVITLIVEFLEDGEISEEEQIILETYLEENEIGNTNQLLYSIDLLVETADGTVSIEETEAGLTLIISLPEGVEAEVFYVTQIIDGQVVLIESTYDEATHSLRFTVNSIKDVVVSYEVSSFNVLTVLGIGGGSLGILGLLWFILFGRRKKEKDEEIVVMEEESMENQTFFQGPILGSKDFYTSLSKDDQTLFDQFFVLEHESHLAKDLHYTHEGDNEAFFKNVFRFIYRYRKIMTLTMLEKLTSYVALLGKKEPKGVSLVYEAAMKTAYTRRQEQGFLDFTIQLARKDIALQRDVLNPRLRFVYSYYRLSIIMEKKKEIKEALVLVNEAIARQLVDTTVGGYHGRKARLDAQLVK